MSTLELFDESEKEFCHVLSSMASTSRVPVQHPYFLKGIEYHPTKSTFIETSSQLDSKERTASAS